jgi:spore coat polysaccharide biosynthesis protein SpsF
MNTEQSSEAARLEALWQGDFGDAYVERNLQAGDSRQLFWHDLLTRLPIQSVLEIGCNIGGNLRWIAEKLPPQQVYGIDINLSALQRLHNEHPHINALYSPARELPFRDRWFDLTFTMGVLIHQPDSTLPLVMNEAVRCSRRYVLCGEYFAAERTEVPYRGQTGALIKRDFGRLYAELFPQLRLIEQAFLGRDQGWDDVTVWLFEKAS